MVDFLQGFNQQNAFNQQRTGADIANAGGALTLLDHIRKAQQAKQLQDALASGDESALMRTPGGLQALLQRAQVQEAQAKLGQSQREAAVFSPENIARNTTPAVPGIAPGIDDLGGGPGRPAQAPQVNIDALRQQAAMTGVKGMEAYSQHQANETQKRQNFALQVAALQERARDADMRSADRNAGIEAQKQGRADAIQARKDIAALAASMRQPPQPQMVTNSEGVFQVGRDGVANPVMGPDGKPLTGKAPEKALPVSASQRLFENNQNLRRARNALDLIEGKNIGEVKGDKNATGWKGFVPDAILQRVDPEGVDTRAAIADLGSLVIHERSGAAVTAAEFPRLRPFIPSEKDDPETAKKKLKRFVQVYEQTANETMNFYKDSGYKVPDSIPTPARRTSDKAAPNPTVDALLDKYK